MKAPGVVRGAVRTQENYEPWIPCPRPVVDVDPDGDALCAVHLAPLWTCPDCGWFLAAGDGTSCATCQAAQGGLGLDDVLGYSDE